MIIWLLLIFFILSTKFFMGNLYEKKKQKKFLIISGIAVILVMGLRYPDYETVYDVRVYYTFYKNLITTGWTEIFTSVPFEPGYVVLNKILATIIPWPQFILIFEAAFCVICVTRFIYKNSEYPFQAMIFYITLGSMAFQLTAFRQSIAICLCLLSVESIKEKKLFKFIIIVLVAMTFHKTAIIFLPFYFVANRKPNWKNNIVTIIAMMGGISLAEVFTRIGNEMMGMDYSGYSGNKLGGLIPIIIYTITIILSILYTRKIKSNIALNMTEIGLTIYIMRYVTQIMERVSFYYTSAVIVQLPNVINKVKNKSTKDIINCLSIILAIALFIYRLRNQEYGNYRFFWQ